MGWVGKTERGGGKEKETETGKENKTKTKTLRLLPSVACRLLSPPPTFFLCFLFRSFVLSVMSIHCIDSDVMLVSSRGPGFWG